uniref:Uncharacterized protein n=1 Tax=Octopus bimaculoides TaxID=37653 RepID=A0A0L8GNK3_OCTBM
MVDGTHSHSRKRSGESVLDEGTHYIIIQICTEAYMWSIAIKSPVTNTLPRHIGQCWQRCCCL